MGQAEFSSFIVCLYSLQGCEVTSGLSTDVRTKHRPERPHMPIISALEKHSVLVPLDPMKPASSHLQKGYIQMFRPRQVVLRLEASFDVQSTACTA